MNIFVIISIIICLIIFIYINYKVIFVSKYNIIDKEIPNSFDGFKILHLSDWHETRYGKNNEKLVDLIKKQSPDIIVITGDMVVRQKQAYKKSIDFIKKLDFCKVYMTLGNHELELTKERLEDFKEKLKEANVVVLDNECDYLEKNGEVIHLYGLTFNSHLQATRYKLKGKVVERYAKIQADFFDGIPKDEYKILLTHDPLNFISYAKMGFDLIYAGHLHGGGIRLFGFGVSTPRKLWYFTRLAGGMVDRYGSKIIVSRGAGNSRFPIRIFNPPEISITTLHSLDSLEEIII